MSTSLLIDKKEWLAADDANCTFYLAGFQKCQPLTSNQVEERREKYGLNVIQAQRKVRWYCIFFAALFHPFNILLGLLALATGLNGDFDGMTVMLFMIIASLTIRFIQEYKSALAAESLRSQVSNTVHVLRYGAPAETGGHLPVVASNVDQSQIPIEELVPGDWVKLSAGDLIPADILLIDSKDLFVSQSSLTGEAIPVEKMCEPWQQKGSFTAYIPSIDQAKLNNSGSKQKQRKSCKKVCSDFFRSLFGLRVDYKILDANSSRIIELDNASLCYMGTSVVSGTAIGYVQHTGSRTYFGSMAEELAQARPQNAFQLGVRRISWIFFLSMVCLVPPVLLLQGFLNDDWQGAFLFSLAVAVGLTPEMLPMIVSANLARGAYVMSKKKCIVKNMDSIINMGGMDVLCTDKTGTLTENRVVLMKHVDFNGQPSLTPVQLAFLNSYFQTGLKNLMDDAIIKFYEEKSPQDPPPTDHGAPDGVHISKPKLAKMFRKLDEIPFDFVRRRMSVLLSSPEENILISKGAVEEVLAICSHALVPHNSERLDQPDLTPNTSRDFTSEVRNTYNIFQDASCQPLSEDMRAELSRMSDYYNKYGLRVIAIAFKQMPDLPPDAVLRKSEETQMTFAGFIAFQDPAKQSSLPAIKALAANHVSIKVLTGDSAAVCRKICEDIQLPVNAIVTTKDLEGASDEKIAQLAESGTIFAKLTPLQKAEIVRALKRNEHVVGFLGDGINDAPALAEADIGISVDNSTDIARDSANIILLEKDLMVVSRGVVEGRSTYGNTMKYIVMAVSSNFGNVFSIMVASSWLKFLPMLPIHILAQNLLYDISQIAIPWDHMDPEFLAVPHRWSMRSVLTFMVFIGPWSSVFDIATYLYMYYYYDIKTPDDNVLLFQTAWFTVGLLTQTLIIHMIRTPKIPFIQSRASWSLLIMTTIIMAIGIALPYIPVISTYLDFVHLDGMVYPFVAGVLILYCICAQIAKIIYLKLFREWY